MIASRQKRRGVVFVVVVILMIIVGGMVGVLAMSSARMYRQAQAERVRSVARAMADSGAAYARVHLRAPAASQPFEPIELDVRGLLPANVTGSLTVSFAQVDDQALGHVVARAVSGACEVEEQIDVELGAAAAASAPATAPGEDGSILVR